MCMNETERQAVPEDIIGGKYLRSHTLLAGVASMVTAIFIWLIPDCPFNRGLAPILCCTALMYLLFFIFFDKCAGYMQRVVLAMSFIGICAMTFVMHMTGGIVSPLVCFYFALLVSEVTYGITSPQNVYFCILSYLSVVLGEASGLLPVTDPLAKAIYVNKYIFFFIVTTVVTHMFLVGSFGRLVLKKLRQEFAAEQKEKQAVVNKLRQLDAFSQIGMLAHRIVHDLRGPLGAISGYVQLQIRHANQAGGSVSLLNELMDTVNKMTEALNDVARFGRVTVGRKERISLAEFFNSLIAILKLHKDSEKVEFRLNYSDKDRLAVMAVRQDLQQAYFNIFKNAVEAMQTNPGAKVFEISMRPSDGMAVVEITNNGPHVPEEILSGVFKKAVTGKADGTGVGMLITHDLLLKNNITIEMSNMEVPGVKVTTHLPFCEA